MGLGIADATGCAVGVCWVRDDEGAAADRFDSAGGAGAVAPAQVAGAGGRAGGREDDSATAGGGAIGPALARTSEPGAASAAARGGARGGQPDRGGEWVGAGTRSRVSDPL